ncbi:hypothetical protein D9757_007864 [Collybiopsis confluens]|uniref:Ubiquitin 3 binding protein But2 C-terminal domain-containing protein n=1 Tax=Collybiopsis confluens TaxID=2823264 RepID=A0A8H5M582_9AGAR|nr:hypothetical protein D9757_007864 [Collybiopsis confluens]
MFSRSSKPYSVLPSDSNGSVENLTETIGPRNWFLSWLPVLVSMFCAATSASILFSRRTEPIASLSSFPQTEIPKLRRPSHFIGFDQITRVSPPSPAQFVNFPILVSQIDRSEPRKVFPVDSRRYQSIIGTINPDDRQVRATKDVSTVVQFMAIDYAMEICELRLLLSLSTLPLSISPSPKPLTLTLNRLDTNTNLDPRSLSFSSRPPTKAKLADIVVDRTKGIDWTRRLPCSMHEVLTFELACSQSDFDSLEECGVEWWQDKQNITSCKASDLQHFIDLTSGVPSISYGSAFSQGIQALID